MSVGGRRPETGLYIHTALQASGRVGSYAGDRAVLCIIRIVLYYVLIRAVLSLDPREVDYMFSNY